MVDEKNTVDVQMSARCSCQASRAIKCSSTESNACLHRRRDSAIRHGDGSWRRSQYRLSELRQPLARDGVGECKPRRAGERIRPAPDGRGMLRFQMRRLGSRTPLRAIRGPVDRRAPKAPTRTFTNTAIGLQTIQRRRTWSCVESMAGAIVYARWVRRTRYAENWLLPATVPLGESS
jgi:hypothetical protein